MKFIFLLFVVFATAQCASIANTDEEAWNAFKAQHDKKYNSDVEEELRMKIFIENKLKIDNHNQKYEKGLVSYSQGINKFSDMLTSEFIATHTGFMYTSLDNLKGATIISPAGPIPDSKNWTAEGAVTEVKDQKKCGSCWAFSSAGSLEGQVFLQRGKLVSLSAQDLVDCSKRNGGCFGGLMEGAYDDIKEMGGIDTEESYPYEGVDGKCRYDPKNSGATVSGSTFLNKTENALTAGIANLGPIAVGIQVMDSFKHYTSGVYYEPNCSEDDGNLNHGVLAVGYGTDKASGDDFYLVKNSWGSEWGEEGYIRMARNKVHNCGITFYALYPQL